MAYGNTLIDTVNAGFNVSFNSSLTHNHTLNCSHHQYLSWSDFAFCYELFFQERSAQALTELSVAFFAFLFNLLVIISIVTEEGKTNTFDTILIGHSIVDGLTGLIDIPLFHIKNFFGYWPLPPWLSTMWSCYDNNINFTTNMHMLYMSYVRLRSIKAPKSYEREILIRHPWRIMISFWAIGLGFWSPWVLAFGIADYELEADFQPEWIGSILNIIMWFTPLFSIIVVSVYIMWCLHVILQNKKKNQGPAKKVAKKSLSTLESELDWKKRLLSKIKKFKISAQTKFTIIILSYWLQWIPPCLLTIANPMCNHCINGPVADAIYWLTFTVCAVDPLVVLILNPNVTISCFRKKKNNH